MSLQRAVGNIVIRACEEGDIAAITGIYAHHVLHGLASFEIEPPSESDMRQRRCDILGCGFPYLVADRTCRKRHRLRLRVPLPAAACLPLYC